MGACDALPAYMPVPLAVAATMFMLVLFVYDIVPYQESTMLQLCRTATAVGNTVYVRSQMTDSRQHAESTTL